MNYLEYRKQFILDGRPLKQKTFTTIKSKSDKRVAKEKEAEQTGYGLTEWFEERRKEMTGKCLHCGGKTWTKEDDERVSKERDDEVYSSKQKTYKHCIAHILPKSLFPSVAIHPLNWLELCFYGKSCHTNMDNNVLDMIDMNCWDTIVERFVAMYPFIDKKERRRIPETLMQYIHTDL